jgi:hypothetical protein
MNFLSTIAAYRHLVAVLSALSSIAFAQEVSVPHEFQSGQPARAAEVNENFDALEGAINSNSSAIAENLTAIEQNANAIADLDAPSWIVLDFFDAASCTIDVPGYYVLDRGWDFTTPGGNGDTPGECSSGITIAADVTIDLRGHRLLGGQYWVRDRPLVVIEPDLRVTFRNGLIAGWETAIQSGNTSQVTMEHVSASGSRLGTNTRIKGGRFFAGTDTTSLHVGSRSTITAATFGGGYDNGPPSLYISADDVTVRHSRIEGDNGLWVLGNGATFTDNDIRSPGNDISGDGNTFARNVIIHDSVRGDGLTVSGTNNVIDGNIIRNFETGMRFTTSGNFYGNNRVSATTPFAGAGDQTDWDGNVSF